VCRSHGGAAPQVKAKARERLADMIDPDRILRSVAEIAHSDLRDFFDENNNLKDPAHWPDHAARTLQTVEVLKSNRISGDGKQEDILKIKTWDKMKALEYLMKHKNLFEQHKKAGAEAFAKATEALAEGRKRAMERNSE